MLKRAEFIHIVTDHYSAVVTEDARLVLTTSAGMLAMDVPLDSAIDTLDAADSSEGAMVVASRRQDGPVTELTFTARSAVWRQKRIQLRFEPACVVYRVTVVGDGERITNANLLHMPETAGGRTALSQVFAPRFDWFDAEVRVRPDQDERLACQQWLSPPPFTYVFEGDGGDGVWVAVSAEAGEFNFQSFDYTGSRGLSFRLPFEAHTTVRGDKSLPDLVIGFTGGLGFDGVRESIEWQRVIGRLPEVSTPREKPAWWSQPIFCAWGQMRYDYRADHYGHENGTFINVTSYCTELRYRNSLAALEAHGVDPGTVVIDMGWARRAALAEPHPGRWTDMRAFIEEQHDKKRKVLLWFTPVVFEGLPREACMLLDGEPVAVDPTSPAYVSILSEQIRIMVGEGDGCLNADGFKLDFTQCVPSESDRFVSRMPHFFGLINDNDDELSYPRLADGRESLITTYEPIWGVEMLRRYLFNIRNLAKKIKQDAMIMTHTANPAFADLVDVLRLNDLDGQCDDVLGVMTARAKIAEICSPHWLIDTDDDLMMDKERWRAYAELQPSLGIPDTYYATGIAQSQEELDADDLTRLREIWDEYRAGR